MNKGKTSLYSVLFLLLLLFLAAVPHGEAQQAERGAQGVPDASYFRSNSLGMALEEITQYQTDDFTYVLKRKKNSSNDQANKQHSYIKDILLKNGEEYNRAEYEWKNGIKYSRFYEDGSLIRETIEKNNRVHEERLYNKNGGSVVYTYEWIKGELFSIKTLHQDDDVSSSTSEYIRGKSGRILQVVELTDKNEQRIRGIYSGSGESGSNVQWHFAEDKLSYFFYSINDKDITERYREGELNYRKQEFSQENQTIKIEVFPKIKKEVRTVFNEEGRKISRSTETPDGLVYENFIYEDGELVESLRKGTDGSQRIVYTPGEGESPDEKIFKDGSLQKEIFYFPEKRRTEVLYRKGEAIVEVEYIGEETVNRRSLLKDSP